MIALERERDDTLCLITEQVWYNEDPILTIGILSHALSRSLSLFLPIWCTVSQYIIAPLND